MAEDESIFKTPALKRKTSNRRKMKKAKKVVDHNGLNVKEVEVNDGLMNQSLGVRVSL